MDLRKSLEEPVSMYSSTDYVSVSITDSVSSAARAMKEAGTGEALIVRDGEPVGIITERDVLYKVVAAGKDPTKTRVQEVMSSPVAWIANDAKVGDAIAKMTKLGVRRLAVLKGSKMVGMVTQKMMVTDTTERAIELPELATPKGTACPYCGAMVRDAEELSKHMDQVHLGQGLLEGDRRKW